MVTLVLGLCGALSYAVSDFLAQRVARGGASVTAAVTWILATGSVISVSAALAAGDVPHGGAAWADTGLATAGGAVYLAAYWSLVRGLRVGDLSLVTPLASLQGAVAAVIAIAVLGEAVTGATMVAIPLAVLGSVLASTAGGPAWRSREESAPAPDGAGVHRPGAPAAGAAADPPARLRHPAAAGAGWGLLCAVATGVVLVIYGEVTAISPLAAVAASRVAGLVLIVPLAVRFGARVPRGLRGTAVLSGALEATGFILIVTALSIGPVAVASVLAAQFATFAVILGLVVGRERPRRTQLVGVVCTIIAVTVLALA